MTETAPASFDGSSTGLTWRPIEKTDIDNWLELIERMGEADNPIWMERREDLEEVFASSKNDPVLNTVLGVDNNGTPRAFGRVTMDDDAAKVLSWGGVDPQWRRGGIGTAIYRWQQDIARQRVADSAAQRAILRTYAEEDNAGHNALMKANGNNVVRYWIEMTRPLQDAIPEAGLDDGLEFVTFSSQISDSIRRAHNDAFQDHWGSEPRDEESWSFTIGHPEFKPEWSMAVVDKSNGEVAGYQMASMDPRFVRTLGYHEGYTELLGVRSAWRGRGIAPAMLVEAMRRFKAGGMDNAGLQVDTENPSGAHGLYRRLGYQPTRRTLTYDKTLV